MYYLSLHACMHVYKKQYHKAQVNQQKKFYEEYIN